MTPILKGTASRLGLRKPEPFATELFQAHLSRLSAELEACGFLNAVQSVGRVMHHLVGPGAERMATERWMRENRVRAPRPGWE